MTGPLGNSHLILVGGDEPRSKLLFHQNRARQNIGIGSNNRESEVEIDSKNIKIPGIECVWYMVHGCDCACDNSSPSLNPPPPPSHHAQTIPIYLEEM